MKAPALRNFALVALFGGAHVALVLGCDSPRLVTAAIGTTTPSLSADTPIAMPPVDVDAGLPPVIRELDAAVTQAPFSTDCVVGLPGTVAVFTFNGEFGADETGQHDGRVVGTGLSSTAGPGECSDALFFPAANDAYVLIEDSPAWDIDEGSIDFWIRAGASSALTTVLSRDAEETAQGGHLLIDLSTSRELVVRLQKVGISLAFRAPLPDSWAHIGINLGQPALQLFINGQLEAEVPVAEGWGLRGNRNPWTIGASQAHSAEGQATPLETFARDLALDHLRISSARRAFGDGP